MGRKKGYYMTIHNHFEGAVLPSYEDMVANLKFNVEYGVITSGSRIGIMKFKTSLTPKQKDLVVAIYSTYHANIEQMFFEKYEYEINNLWSPIKKEKEFDRFLSKNNDEFVEELNSRLKEYNIEMTYINME